MQINQGAAHGVLRHLESDECHVSFCRPGSESEEHLLMMENNKAQTARGKIWGLFANKF